MSCMFNPMVDCETKQKDCYGCGWNPVVHERRVKKLREYGFEDCKPLSRERFVTVYESNEDGVGDVRLFKELDEASAYIEECARDAYDKMDYDTTMLDITPMLAYIEGDDLRETWSVHRVAI